MEDLLLYYIRCRVEERSPQGKLCMEKFYSGKPQKDDSDPTPLQCALVKMCKRIEKEHAQVFYGLVEKLQMDTLQDTLQLLMTEGHGLTYGRLVVLVSFSGYACNRYATVHTMPQFVVLLGKLQSFFKTAVNPWVCEHGGLEEIQKFLCIVKEHYQALDFNT